MMKTKILFAASMIAFSSTLALAQGGGGGGPSPGDARPPGALKQGGIPPAAAMRRGDDMSPTSNPMGAMKGKHKKMAMHKKRKHKTM